MTHPAYDNENDLIRALREGDEQAFSIIFKKYWYQLYTTAYSKMLSHDGAEEIVQEIMVTLWEKRNVLLITNLNHYLNVALKNKCIDHIRRNSTKEKYWQYIKNYFPAMHTQEGATTDDLESAIQEGMELVSEKSRNIFKLNHVEGLSNAEIANRINLSEKSVEYHITKTIKHLRSHLKDYLVSFIFLIGKFFF